VSKSLAAMDTMGVDSNVIKAVPRMALSVMAFSFMVLLIGSMCRYLRGCYNLERGANAILPGVFSG